MAVGLKLSGFTNLNKFLAQLPVKPIRRAANGALLATLKPIRQQIKSNLIPHKRTGNLSRSLFTKKIKKRNPNIVAAAVGFKQPAGNRAIILEKGTPPRVNAAGHGTGAVQGVHFFQRALDLWSRKYVYFLAREMKSRFAKEVIKLARKNRSLK